MVIWVGDDLDLVQVPRAPGLTVEQDMGWDGDMG